jgi:hypothetical protein
MAGFNQLVVDTKNGLVMHRASLTLKDDTAVFETLQKFTPDEADHFADALRAAANTARTAAESKAKEQAKSKGKGKKTSKRKGK